MKGPFLSTKDAASYCGFKSAQSFRNAISDYRIPRHGPSKNKYATSTLDDFMLNPQAYKPGRDFYPSRNPLTLEVPDERS